MPMFTHYFHADVAADAAILADDITLHCHADADVYALYAYQMLHYADCHTFTPIFTPPLIFTRCWRADADDADDIAAIDVILPPL